MRTCVSLATGSSRFARASTDRKDDVVREDEPIGALVSFDAFEMKWVHRVGSMYEQERGWNLLEHLLERERHVGFLPAIVVTIVDIAVVIVHADVTDSICLEAHGCFTRRQRYPLFQRDWLAVRQLIVDPL